MVLATNQLATGLNCALCKKSSDEIDAITHGENEKFHLIHKSCMKVIAEWYDSCPVDGCGQHINKKDLFTWKDKISLMSTNAKLLVYSSLFRIGIPLGGVITVSIARIISNSSKIGIPKLKEFSLVVLGQTAGLGLGVGIAFQLGAGLIQQTTLGVIFGGAIHILLLDYFLNKKEIELNNYTNEDIIKNWRDPGLPTLHKPEPTIIPLIFNSLKEGYETSNQILNTFWKNSQESALKKLCPIDNEETVEQS